MWQKSVELMNSLLVRLLCAVHAMQLNWHFSSVQFCHLVHFLDATELNWDFSSFQSSLILKLCRLVQLALAHRAHWKLFTVSCNIKSLTCLPGPSRATAGPRKTFSPGPQTISWSPSGEKIFEFLFSKWCILVLSLIHIWRCRRIERCRSRWSPYH